VLLESAKQGFGVGTRQRVAGGLGAILVLPADDGQAGLASIAIGPVLRAVHLAALVPNAWPTRSEVHWRTLVAFLGGTQAF
jgi:hypothetical protein